MYVNQQTKSKFVNGLLALVLFVSGSFLVSLGLSPPDGALTYFNLMICILYIVCGMISGAISGGFLNRAIKA